MKIMLVNFLKVVNSAGGAERVFCNMANEFVKRNYDVYAICCDWEKGLPFYKLDNRVNFINIDGSGTQTEFAKYLKFAREVLRLFKKVSNDNPYDNEKNRYWSTKLEPVINEIKPDIIVAYDLQSVCILKNILSIKIPVIAMIHSNVHIMFDMNISNYELSALNKVNCVQVLLNSDKNIANNYLKVPVVQIPNVVPQFNKSANLLNQKEFYKITFIGRLDKNVKRPDILIDAFLLLLKEFNNWRVEIWGGIEDKKYYDSLQNKIKKNNAENRIKLCGVAKDVPNILFNSDIFAFTSSNEGFGLSLAEAMSAGLPCIGFKSCAALNELVQNNKTGILTEDGIAAFAEGLKKLMNNKDLRIKLGAAAKESMKKYEDVKIWDKWEMLINKVAGEK